MHEAGLPRELFRRADESADDQFYRSPRLVTHIDDGAIRAVTDLYRRFFPPGGVILDLMGSWVSHLPAEIAYGRVVGHGMNARELSANSRLDESFVQNLNADPRLPYDDATFDAAGCCVSVQYLTNPTAVFAEVRRVLKPGAPFVVTFSNRCFPTKAVAIWQSLDDDGHVSLVERYFAASEGWDEPETSTSRPRRGDPLYGVVARSRGIAPSP